jgi:signal transduction histidine kinase
MTALAIATALCGAALAVAAAALARARRAVALARHEAEGLAQRLARERTEGAATADLLRAVVESTPAATVLFDDRGRITFTNHAARELFFEGAAVEGQNFLTMLEGAPEPLRRALLGDDDELFTVGGDAGEPETFHLSKRVFAVGGEPQTLVAVRHMTQEISRQDLATLRKVIRVISHEINNSLGPIASLAASGRLLAARPDALPKLAPILETIEERSRHLCGFLDGYARLAKLPDPRPTVVAWGPLLDELRPLWPRVKIAAPPEKPGFFDRAQIQQVLINLLKNASEAGGPPEEVAVEVEPAPEGGVWVSVLDRGAGLPEPVLQNAFVPFFTTKEKGSGLGLALCREIVLSHRGRMRLGRRDGGGARAAFWLPDRERPAQAALAASRARLTLSGG